LAFFASLGARHILLALTRTQAKFGNI